jgi:hypothetical protein
MQQQEHRRLQGVMRADMVPLVILGVMALSFAGCVLAALSIMRQVIASLHAGVGSHLPTRSRPPVSPPNGEASAGSAG